MANKFGFIKSFLGLHTIFPYTKAQAVSTDDGNNVQNVLNKCVQVEAVTPYDGSVPVNADKLGGVDAINIVTQKGNWNYVVGSIHTSNFMRWKVVNNRCYVEIQFENLTLSPTQTKFINDGTLPIPYDTVNRVGMNGANTNQTCLFTVNMSGGLLIGASTSGQYYPLTAFDYEIA